MQIKISGLQFQPGQKRKSGKWEVEKKEGDWRKSKGFIRLFHWYFSSHIDKFHVGTSNILIKVHKDVQFLHIKNTNLFSNNGHEGPIKIDCSGTRHGIHPSQSNTITKTKGVEKSWPKIRNLASLSSVYIKKKQVILWICTFNSSTHDAEAGGSQVQHHYELFRKTLSQKANKQRAMAILLKTENDGAWELTKPNCTPSTM